MMKRIIAFLLVLVLSASAVPCTFAAEASVQTVQSFAEIPAYNFAEPVRTSQAVRAVLVCENVISTVNTGSCMAVGRVNGEDYFYLPITGKKLNVYNMDAGTFVTQIDTPFNNCRGIIVDNDGRVWMVGDSPCIFHYDPILNVGTIVYNYAGELPDVTSAFGLYYDGGENGCLYFGTDSGAYLVKYDTRNGLLTNLGTHGGDSAAYSGTPVYKEGYAYYTAAGDTNRDGKRTIELFKVDATTGVLKGRLDITDHVSQNEVMLRGMNICGNVLLIGGESNQVPKALAVDAQTMEVIDIGVDGFIAAGVEVDYEQAYFYAMGKGVYTFNGWSRTATKIANSDVPLYGHANSMMTIGNTAQEVILTYRTSDRCPIIINPQNGNVREYPDLVKEEHGTGTPIQSLIAGPAGSNQFLLSGSHTEDCVIYDTVSGKNVKTVPIGGQVDAMYISEGNLYLGVSGTAAVTRIDLGFSDKKTVLLSLKNMYSQSGISTITGSNSHVFFASIPEQYQYGGCLGMYGGLGTYTHRNLVQDQSIVSIAHYQDFLFCGTSIEGGLGTTPIEGTSAKVFVYDVDRHQKVTEYDLRDYISGLPSTINSVSGIVADPNVDTNHKFWGVAGGLLFSFEIDPATKEIRSFQKELDFGGAAESDLFPVPMMIQEGYLYTQLGINGGVRKINLSNTADNAQLPIPSTRLFTIANDGNLYYASGNDLFLYPLNAESADRTAAQALDDRILAIGVVTAASEATIKQIRGDYDRLTNVQKALVQNLDKLRTAEIDLLRIKIESIGEVTLEDEAVIHEAMEIYNELTMDERGQVDHITLMAANRSLTAMQKAAASAVEALIFSIGDVSLKSADGINSSRKAYDALTPGSKIYVKNLQMLEDAEVLLDKMIKEQAEKDKAKEDAEKVDKLIKQIGTVNHDSGSAIREAREAYEDLSDEAKKYVERLDDLEDAEEEFENLGLRPETVTVIVIAAVAVVVLAAGAVVTIFVLKKRKKTA